MTNNYILTIFVSLVSGVIATIVSMSCNFFSNKRTNRLEYLRRQIDELYGPLFFGHFQKEILHELCNESIELTKKDSSELDTKLYLYEKLNTELISHLQEFTTLLQHILKTKISLIDIEDINELQSGIKALKAICIYHNECEKNKNDPNHLSVNFSGDKILKIIREAGDFFKTTQTRFYSKKDDLIKFNRGFNFRGLLYKPIKLFKWINSISSIHHHHSCSNISKDN